MHGNSGARWHRWEPHVHAPGTVLNDQFKGDWDKYLAALEEATPVIRAVGVADYYSTEAYERLIAEKAKGRLPQCDLVFPNIEMRLVTGTSKGRFVNIHLLVCPDDPDHVAELSRFLARLSFSAFGDMFACTRGDLIRLGKRSDDKIVEDRAALAAGSVQFKVSLDGLKDAYSKSNWAKNNIWIAVAGSETDGTAGVRDAADTTLRQEIEAFAHIIFASSGKQREFWLGQGAVSKAVLRERYGGLKPCLHGSDAHENRKVGLPDGDRYSWVKGVPAFDTLRQACIDPGGRAFVGSQPPMAATPSRTIAKVEIGSTSWAKSPVIELNPGLVAIIGARGSGKTALADIIACGCDATADHTSEASFLNRARELLTGSSVTVTWEAGDRARRQLDGSGPEAAAAYPRARYLSQQFVEELCSADGMADGLIREIQRVVFEAHTPADRDGTSDFDELLQLRANRHREARRREEDALATIAEQIGIEREKERLASSVKTQVDEKAKQLANYAEDRKKLVPKTAESEGRVQRLAALAEAAEQVRRHLRALAGREQSLIALKDEVDGHRNHGAPNALRAAKEKHKASHLKEDEWQKFLLEYTGDVDGTLTAQLAATRERTKDWKGTPTPPPLDPTTALIADDAVLTDKSLALLEAESRRIEQLISVDKETASKFGALSKRIAEETALLEKLKERLADYEGAKDRSKELRKARDAAYVRVFESIAAEQLVLAGLYAPLQKRLASEGATLKKLSFSVRREVDVGQWAADGEGLLDLRVQGEFKGRGSLKLAADAALKGAWESGDPAAIGAAMAAFIEKYRVALLDQSSVPKTDQVHYRDWLKRFAKWLYSTDHITLHYSVDYGNVDIRKLSPGTRGIVLLLLYLALDDQDDRPLIIDQPEENLDPKSIYDELVTLFLAAKVKRQVILVTHNANLVINADADQIIVASASPHPAGELPPIEYQSGGLEEAHIRKLVCDILEGGELAFQERARRLRVRLER